MKVFKEAVLPLGFKAHAVSCGIKKTSNLDLALFYSEVPCVSAHLFTTNAIKAAPILLNQEHLKKTQTIQAILVNSGNANCFTGRQGINDARLCASHTARLLKIDQAKVLVSSTGIIGRRLPWKRIIQALPFLVGGLSPNGIHNAARAIMTTDTFPKEITVQFKIGQRWVSLCGIAKGAGMIQPHLATMLCFLFTDANISSFALRDALKNAAEESFHCISVDGCMSTNDTVSIMASGLSGCPKIRLGKDLSAFSSVLRFVCLELAKMIIRDAEGATKFVQITVKKAKDQQEAKRIALAVANSNLFKTAVFASSPNVFGRIVAACGSAGVNLNPDRLKINFTSLDKKEIKFDIAVGRGNATAKVFTSDLSYQYVKINAEYN